MNIGLHRYPLIEENNIYMYVCVCDGLLYKKIL